MLYRGQLLTEEELAESGGRDGNCPPGTRFRLLEPTTAYVSMRSISLCPSQTLVIEAGVKATRLRGVYLDDKVYVWISVADGREYLVSGDTDVEVIESPPGKDQAMFLFPPS